MAANFYMDIVLSPRRSLSKSGFYWLIGFLIVVNLAMAVFLLVIGAFPVPIFLLIDVVGVFIAFRVSYSRAGQVERVQVTADEVRVSHEFGARARTVWRSPTAFTRVSVDQPGEHEACVRLHLSAQALTLARTLSPAERTDFAEALETAIRQARAERY